MEPKTGAANAAGGAVVDTVKFTGINEGTSSGGNTLPLILNADLHDVIRRPLDRQ